MTRKAKFIEHVFYQVGLNEKDTIGEYFKAVFDKTKEASIPSAEIQQFKNSDTMLYILRIDNRVKAFGIETRTDFNDIEIITGEV